MTAQPVIVADPAVMNGMPCFRGTRVPFKNLMAYLEGGHSLGEFLDQFPSVTREMAVGAQRSQGVVARQDRMKILLDECLRYPSAILRGAHGRADAYGMDALVVGPALAAAFVVSMYTGKLALWLLMGRILRPPSAR